MARSRRLIGVVVCVSLFLPAMLFSARVARADVDLRAEVTQLFSEGEKYSAKSLEAVNAHYSQLRAEVRDPRLEYAYLLMLIRQHDDANALRLAGAICTAYPTASAPLRTKIWLQMNKKSYAAALLDLETLSKLLPPDDAAGEAETPHQDLARFMGRMFGFLEGPAGESVNEATREEQKNKIFSRLTTSRREAFEEGRRVVLKRFGDIDLKEGQVKADTKVIEDQEKEQQKQQLEQEKLNVGQQQSEVNNKIAQVKADLDRELGELDRSIRPLAGQLSALQRTANSQNRDLLSVQGQIGDLALLSQNERDPNRRLSIALEINNLSAAAENVRRNLAATNADANAVNGQLVALQQQRAATAARGQDALNELDRANSTLRREDGRIRNDQRKANQPSTGVSARSRSISAKLNAFTTYEEFPLEQEKQRLLDALGAK